MPTYYYQSQEKAFAPGIAGEWPKVMPKPDNQNGRLVRCDGLQELLISADSELSAIAHGRPADKQELLRICFALRKIYEGSP